MKKTSFALLILLIPALCISQVQSSAASSSDADYEAFLSAFGESTIEVPKNSNIEIYRAVIISAFLQPLFVRIERNANEYTILAKRFSGRGGYEWGGIDQNTIRHISEGEWKSLLKSLKKLSFWKLPAQLNEDNGTGLETVCLDGTDWFIEGLRENERHLVEQAPCSHRTDFELVLIHMAKLAQLDSTLSIP